MNNIQNYFKNIAFLILFFPFSFFYSHIFALELPKISNESMEEFTSTWVHTSYRTFSDKDGLPLNTIMALDFDSNGYLWVGTQNGLSVYDGTRFENFSLSSLVENKDINDYVMYIHNSASQVLWTVNYDGNVINRKDNIWKEVIVPYKSKKERVIFITEEEKEDKSWRYFLVTQDQVLIFDNEKWIASYQTENPKDSISKVDFCKQANKPLSLFLLLKNNRILFYQNNKWLYLQTPLNEDLKISAIHTGKTPSDSSSLTIATNLGVFVYNTDNKMWTTLLTEKELGIFHVQKLWKTYTKDSNAFLYLIDRNNNKFLKYNYRSKYISHLEDSFNAGFLGDALVRNEFNITNDIWIKTFSAGLLHLRNSMWSELKINTSIKDFNPSSFIETSDKYGKPILWIGTFRNGLIKLHDNKVKIFNKKNGFCSDIVLHILESYDEKSKEDILWVASKDCLAKIVNDIPKYYVNKEDNSIKEGWFRSLLETKNNFDEKTLWISAGDYLLTATNNSLEEIKISQNFNNVKVQHLAETKKDGKSILWLATNIGLLKFEDNKITKTYNKLNGLPCDSIYTLSVFNGVNGVKELWLLTQNQGLVIASVDDLHNDNPKWKLINQNNFPALPEDTISSIVFDNQNMIYLFTTNGIIRLSSSPYSTPIDKIKTYTFSTNDGLPSNEFNTNATAYSIAGNNSNNSHIWAGTPQGAVFYSIKDEFRPKTMAPFHLKSSLIEGGIQKDLTKTSLSYKENNLKFDFRLLSFFKEMEIQYSYQLQGLDTKTSNWSKKHEKEFTTLPDGSYIFNVWAKDHENNIIGPISKPFTISPPPWKTRSAVVFYIAFSLAGIWGFIKWKLHKNIIRQQELEAIIENKTKELKIAINELNDKNHELELNNIEIDKKNLELNKKNEELDNKNVAIIKKHQELESAYEDLAKSRAEAERIFSSLATALPGTILDNKYKLEKVIGMGGFAVVYSAIHLSLDKPVAIKILRPQSGTISSKNIQKFLKEAVSTSKINHLNAVVVFDTGISSTGVAYIVMELLEGETLSKRIETQKIFTIKEALDIIKPVCDVLHYAHKTGIIHRDIKPENIFLQKQINSDKPIVKLLDFGIAKEILVNPYSPMTQTQDITGTPHYMAPERLLGSSSDEKVDVYATAMVLYEMLSGSTPFNKQANSVGELFIQHLNETATPIILKNNAIPQKLSDYIGYALEKEPISRPSIMRFWKMLSEFYTLDNSLENIELVQKTSDTITSMNIDINSEKHNLTLRPTLDNFYENLMNNTVKLDDNSVDIIESQNKNQNEIDSTITKQ